MIEEIKSPNLSMTWFYNPPFVLQETMDLFHLGWQLWMQMLLYVKSFLFITGFKRTFTCGASLSFYVLLAATRLKCKLKIQKAGDFSLAWKSAWFNLVNAHPVSLSYIYMCICRLYAHIYCRYTCTVCIVTYIWFYGSKLLSRVYEKNKTKKNTRAAGLRRSNSNWEPTASDHPEQSSDTTQIRRT